MIYLDPGIFWTRANLDLGLLGPWPIGTQARDPDPGPWIRIQRCRPPVPGSGRYAKQVDAAELEREIRAENPELMTADDYVSTHGSLSWTYFEFVLKFSV